MTRNQIRDKISACVAELSRLSRDGWSAARPCDYEPVEAELREMREFYQKESRRDDQRRG